MDVRNHGPVVVDALWGAPSAPQSQESEEKPTTTGSAREAATVVMMGVPFDSVTSEAAVNRVDAMIDGSGSHLLATANANFLRLAQEDGELRQVLREADLVVCDGTPLVWASRWLGTPLPERVAGSELVPSLLDRAQAKGHRVFFLGGRDDVLAAAGANMRRRWPRLAIAGMYSPPFAPLDAMDHRAITQRIADSKADLLLVSFGCPKQEKWLARHLSETGAAVGIGVGATIDFLAGQVRQAPRWMRRWGLEWIWRASQEPQRLIKRYGQDLGAVAPGLLAQWWRWRLQGIASLFNLFAVKPRRSEAAGRCHGLSLPPRLDGSTILPAMPVPTLGEGPGWVDLDASLTRSWNAAGLGQLMRYATDLRKRGGRCRLQGASASLRATLVRMKLDGECLQVVPQGEGRAQR